MGFSRWFVSVAILLSCGLPLGEAEASILLETAPHNPSANKGGPTIDAQASEGWRFTVTDTWIVDSVGANFYGHGGTIFAGIMSLPSMSSLPPSPLKELLPADFIASALFAPPDTVADATFTFSSPVTLSPGVYALLFIGQQPGLGATGAATLNDDHVDSGTPSRFNTFINGGVGDGIWEEGGSPNTRIFINGTVVRDPGAVPEPVSLLVWAGLATMVAAAGTARRRAG